MVSEDFPPLAEFPTIVYNTVGLSAALYGSQNLSDQGNAGRGIFSFFSHFAITGLHGAVVLKGQ
jgi:hypothetical protein